MRRKAREFAVQMLYAVDLNPDPPQECIDTFWELNHARPDVVAYATELVRGTIRKKKEIDRFISTHSSHWKIDRMPVTDRNILRLATYELLEEASVPSKVVINEAIELAKKFGTTDSATFVNGVLDSIHQELLEAHKTSPSVP
jgi:transcription antitermination factor NusB